MIVKTSPTPSKTSSVIDPNDPNVRVGEDLEWKDFILIARNHFDKLYCENVSKQYDILEENGFISNDAVNYIKKERQDTSVFFPRDMWGSPVQFSFSDMLLYNDRLKRLVEIYKDQYLIEVNLYQNVLKFHKVREGQGYFTWHSENDGFNVTDRVLAFMTYLRIPEEGGETEFIFQKYRHVPEVGTTLIWPADFTHKHRGGMVIKGEKVYVTGWIMATPDNF
tara:strand:- start:48 stop:713 length:666 start_codon:yes stop_codon:yes gene_type:complete